MKRPTIVVSLFLLAGLAGLGWRNDRKIAALREHCGEMTAKLTTMGIEDSSSTGGGSRRGRERPDIHAETLAFSAALIELAGKLSPPSNSLAEDPALRRAVIEMADKLEALNAARLRIVIGEIRADDTLDRGVRESLLKYLIDRLSDDHPQEAVELAFERFVGNHTHIVPAGPLSQWAARNPAEASAWLENHLNSFPDDQLEWIRFSLIGGIMRRDPALALQFLENHGLTNRGFFLMAWDNQTPEEKAGVLAALRARSVTLSDPETRDGLMRKGIESMALRKHHGTDLTFEEATGWFDRAGLSPDELEFLVHTGLPYYMEPSETGRWIEWITGTFPPEKYRYQLKRIFEHHRTGSAAKAWLESLPQDEAERLREQLALD